MQEVVQLTLHEERMIQLKKQFMAVVIALLVCLGYTGAMVPATAFAAEATIGYVDLNTVFPITLICQCSCCPESGTAEGTAEIPGKSSQP